MNPAQQLDTHYRKADRFMLVVVWLLLAMSFGLAPMYHTFTWAFFVGVPVALVATACAVLMPGGLPTRLFMGAAMMIFTGLHIHQAAGVTELHFGVFVLLAVLVCYRDWRVILTAAIVIAVHHVSFDYLQELGYGVICFTEPGLGRVATHAAYVVVESAILCYVAVWLHRDAVQAAELEYVVASLCPE
ncbi:MAG TPA: chemotaxis protein, partial [Pusillimonas sp.]|nr:chemotaxis protein [Pusillimonas sp.]